MAEEPQALEAKQLWLLKGLVDEGVEAGGAREKLEARQSAFIDHYLEHLNGAKAATLAGYSERSARQIAHRLLTNVDIRRELRRRLEERVRERQLSFDGVLDLIRKLAQSDQRTLYRADGSFKPPQDWPDDIAPRVAGVETEESWSVNGLELTERQAEILRAALHAAGVKVGEIAELVMVRVVKLKLWDPNKAAELLARYRKILQQEEPPPAPPLLQVPQAAAERERRRYLPGDDAVPVPAIVDGRAERLDTDGNPTTPNERRSR
jgi:hypothetical protein